MKYSGKLELTWVNKNKELNIEPRILVEDKTKSYGDPNAENMLIHGDNLIALKALERDFAGKIKCVYIDPPYNTGAAFEHYDDNVEHSIWLSLMYPRLKLLRSLMSEDGLIFIQIDDNEQAYLKIMCDEIFGRANFITSIAVKMSTVSGVKTSHREKTIVKEKEYILVYSKDSEKVSLKPQYTPIKFLDSEFQYFLDRKNSINSEKWEVKRLSDVLKENNLPEKIDEIDLTLNNELSKSVKEFIEKNKDCIWRRAFIRNEFKQLSQDNPDKFFVNNDGKKDHIYYRGREMFFVRDKMHLCMTEEGFVTRISNLLADLWVDINTGKLFNEGGVEFRNSKKPEFLVARIIEMSTRPNDWVLDSFLGSGTTAAVAQKMKRKWIGIELGDHAYSHCAVRINGVIDGNDKAGVSSLFSWHGGGGYKFYELAEPLLVKNPIIPVYDVNPTYTFEMVCEAICKIDSFTYAPADFYHGYSTENRFIHVTLEYVNGEYVADLASKLSEKQSLIIYCLKHQRDIALPDNIEIRRIPKDIQEKCSFESEEE